VLSPVFISHHRGHRDHREKQRENLTAEGAEERRKRQLMKILCWSAYILGIGLIFLSGLKIVQNREVSGYARVGFRRKEKYRITGTRAVLHGKAYMLAAIFWGLGLLLGTISSILGGENVGECFAGGGCSLGWAVLVLGSLISSTGIEYLKHDDD
jgi:hypothetical protein